MKCKVCVGKAQFTCGHCKTESYCSQICQSNDWSSEHKWACKSIGLKTPADSAGPAVNDDNVIGIETSDGRKFRISRDEAMQFQTIRHLIEDASADDYIPLPSVSAQEFISILSLMRQRYFETLRASLYLGNEMVTRVLLKDLLANLMRANDEALWKEFQHLLNIAAFLAHVRVLLEFEKRNKLYIDRGLVMYILEYNFSPLPYAMQHDELELFKFFLKDASALEINTALKYGEMPYFWFNFSERTIYWELLVALPPGRGLDLSLKIKGAYDDDELDLTMLGWAISYDDYKTVNLLLQDGRSNIDDVPDNVLEETSPKTRNLVNLYRRKKKKPVPEVADYAINNAAAVGDYDTVRMILQANPGRKYPEALRIARENGHERIVKLLENQ